MAEICEVENKLLRRIIGKLVHLIQVEEDAIGMTLNDEWQRPVFEEAKLYASTVGTDVMTTEANRITELGAELTQARAERDAAREALEKADKMNEVLNASTSGHFWADIADAQEEYIAARAAIKAEGE